MKLVFSKKQEKALMTYNHSFPVDAGSQEFEIKNVSCSECKVAADETSLMLGNIIMGKVVHHGMPPEAFYWHVADSSVGKPAYVAKC